MFVLKLNYKNRYLKILSLSAIFFALGLILFIRSWLSMMSETGKPARISLSPSGYAPGDVEQMVAARPLVLSNYPSPDTFITFDLPASKSELTFKINCKTDYYVLLIFSKTIDYRKAPTLAGYNKAYECGKQGEFSASIDLKELNLNRGSYYLVRAHQDREGSWYEPY